MTSLQLVRVLVEWHHSSRQCNVGAPSIGPRRAGPILLWQARYLRAYPRPSSKCCLPSTSGLQPCIHDLWCLQLNGAGSGGGRGGGHTVRFASPCPHMVCRPPSFEGSHNTEAEARPRQAPQPQPLPQQHHCRPLSHGCSAAGPCGADCAMAVRQLPWWKLRPLLLPIICGPGTGPGSATSEARPTACRPLVIFAVCR